MSLEFHVKIDDSSNSHFDLSELDLARYQAPLGNAGQLSSAWQGKYEVR